MMLKKQNFENWINLHNGHCQELFTSDKVSASWKRSETLNIDYDRALPKELTPKELERTKKAYKRLTVCSDWAVKKIIETSPDKDMRLLLFNKEGVLLRIYGTTDENDWILKTGIKSGTKWTEQNIGTNPFSVGVLEEAHTDLLGALNYSKFLIEGSYYFAPIYFKETELFGGIVVAIPIEKTNRLLSSIAISLARTIELDIFLFQSIDIFVNGGEDTGSVFLRQTKDKNEIVIINDQVFRILGLNKADNYHLTLENIILPLPDNREFWNIINNRKSVSNRAMYLSVKNGKVYVSISTSNYKANKFHPDGLTIHFSSIKDENRSTHKYIDNNAKHTFSDIIGENEAMRETVKRSRIAALSDSNILIQGESGVGKDILAQAIHNGSKRSHKPFVAVNCAAFSKELISSELFGYESGAFTGAKREGSIGKFELANHGTLFLDEIGDMPLDVQSVLLRVLEEKTFRKVGGNKLIEVDVRVIAATNKNLKELIEKRLFREDLFYRLSVIRINIPPLRNRGADVYLFADYYIKLLCEKMDKPDVRLSNSALDFLGRYTWPGNIRELQNLLEGIISTHEETLIGEKEIQNYLGDYFMESVVNKKQNVSVPFDLYGMDEREKFEMALRHCRNNKTKAAEYLGMSRSTFYRRMQELGMR